MRSVTPKGKIGGKAVPDEKMTSKVNPEVKGECFDSIATGAYYRAEARGFTSGQELDDWLQAESEFNQRRAG
ncbi:MAG: DUF2934 domain-containing protein [Rhodocyclaceae bacterium]|nr:DUF2934 domain-containing protein [Rhodocyclaceae bacterium]